MLTNVSASPARSPVYARIPLFNSEKGLKCMHFPLILPSCVSLAAISRPLIIILFLVCLRPPISICRAIKPSAIESIESLILIWIPFLRKKLIKLSHVCHCPISFILSTVRYSVLRRLRSIGFRTMPCLVAFVSYIEVRIGIRRKRRSIKFAGSVFIIISKLRTSEGLKSILLITLKARLAANGSVRIRKS
jgi:hypothetical protein